MLTGDLRFWRFYFRACPISPSELRRSKTAIKVRVFFDLRAAISVFVRLRMGMVYDVRIMNQVAHGRFAAGG